MFGRMVSTIAAALCCTGFSVADDGIVQRTTDRSERPFRTLFVTRSLAHERLVPYLQEARPEIVQIGNYGAMFHGYADNPRSMKSPMLLPVSGERAALEFQQQLNEKVHGLGLNVVGHFRLTKVMADWKEQSGFVDYYNNRWPDDLLGPKPHPELIELLQRDSDGVPIQLSRYDNAQLALCLSSPHARNMLKQMLKCAVDHGVDGVITTYNYRQNCACEFCQTAFRKWLADRLTPQQLSEKLGIAQLDQHAFKPIPVQIPGYPDPAEADELDWLAAQWGAEHFKKMYDDIFITYGRSLKDDLLVAQWNHLSHVSIKEERMFLPQPQWGREEDYFWYSGGASFVGKNLKLAEGKAGDAWLSCLYVRELSGRKPFLMGKYDGIRLAASMAEGYATGGAGMGRYMRFEDPTGFEVLTRYTRFMHQHRGLYDNAEPFADAALVLPRQSVWNRQPKSLDLFRELGQQLVERQVLLDVVADENLTTTRLESYPAVILPGTASLSDSQLTALREYARQGGLILAHGEIATLTESGASRNSRKIELANYLKADTSQAIAELIVSRLKENGASVIDAPWTVRATAYQNDQRTLLHLVNYDRDESVNKQLKGPELERPKTVENIAVTLRLPRGRKASSVTLHSPDGAGSQRLEFRNSGGMTKLTVPRVTVYGVVEVNTEPTVTKQQ